MAGHPEVGVVSRPMDELVVKNSKYAKGCEELHMANKNIIKLADFDHFENLEVLWLNDNRIRQLSGLDANFRIKELYVHNNAIATLRDSSISEMTFLHVLTLFNNRLSDLSSALGELSRLRHLEKLDLFGNPLAEEKDYRLHVIKQLPWLHVFDRHVITDDERLAARKLKPLATDLTAAMAGAGGASKSAEKEAAAKTQAFQPTAEASAKMEADGLGGTVASGPLATQGSAAAERERRVMRVMRFIKIGVKQQRLLLKSHFLDQDRRRELVVSEAYFREWMTHYDLWPADPTDAEALVAKYTKAAPQRSAGLGRDPRLSAVRWIDYIQFCRDIEPRTGGRDHDDLQRRLAIEWAMKVPEKSKMTQVLTKEVGAYKARLREAEARQRREMVGMSETDLPTTTINKPTFEGPFAPDKGCSFGEAMGMIWKDTKLNPWGYRELKKFFEAADEGKSGALTREQLKGCLKAMELHGVEYEVVDVEDPEADEEAKEDFDPSTVRSEDDVEFDKIFDVFEDNAGKDGKVAWKPFLDVLVNGMTDPSTDMVLLNPLVWSQMSIDSVKAKHTSLFNEAGTLYHQVMTAATHDEAATRRVADTANYATRLDRLAPGRTRSKSAVGRRKGPPVTMIAAPLPSESARRDVIMYTTRVPRRNERARPATTAGDDFGSLGGLSGVGGGEGGGEGRGEGSGTGGMRSTSTLPADRLSMLRRKFQATGTLPAKPPSPKQFVLKAGYNVL